MFHPVPEEILARMRILEAMDAKDRMDGTPRLERLRQIPAQTGRYLAVTCASAPEGRVLEVGTSGGYSTLWLALACRATGRKITTFEVLEGKAALARETFREAKVEDVVNLVAGDAREFLQAIGGVGFCFLDAEKEIYGDCYELVVPNLVPEAFSWPTMPSTTRRRSGRCSTARSPTSGSTPSSPRSETENWSAGGSEPRRICTKPPAAACPGLDPERWTFR